MSAEDESKFITLERIASLGLPDPLSVWERIETTLGDADFFDASDNAETLTHTELSDALHEALDERAFDGETIFGLDVVAYTIDPPNYAHVARVAAEKAEEVWDDNHAVNEPTWATRVPPYRTGRLVEQESERVAELRLLFPSFDVIEYGVVTEPGTSQDKYTAADLRRGHDGGRAIREKIAAGFEAVLREHLTSANTTRCSEVKRVELSEEEVASLLLMDADEETSAKIIEALRKEGSNG